MSLWSFEGRGWFPRFTTSGGHSGGGTPLPIPNRAVKPASADGTRRATSRESRTPPDSLPERPPRAAFRRSGRGLRRAQLLAPAGIELAQPAHPLADRRMGHEQPGEAFVGERIDRVQRLGRRACLEVDELRRLLEPDE